MASLWADKTLNDFSTSPMSSGMCPSVFDKFDSDLGFCISDGPLFDLHKEENLFSGEKPSDILGLDDMKKENLLDGLFDFGFDNLEEDKIIPLDFGADLDLMSNLTKDNFFEDDFIDFSKLTPDDEEMKDTFGFNFIKSDPEDAKRKDDFSLDTILQPPDKDILPETTAIKVEPYDTFKQEPLEFLDSELHSTDWTPFLDSKEEFNTGIDLPDVKSTLPTVVKVSKIPSRETPVVKKSVSKNPTALLVNSSTSTIRNPVKRVVVCSADKSRNIICNVVKSCNQSAGKVFIKNHLGGRALVIPRNQHQPIRVNVIPKKSSVPKHTVSIQQKLNEDDVDYIDLVRPETPQSLVGSDDELPIPKIFNVNKNKRVRSVLSPKVRYYNYVDDDIMNSDSYKCLPPAEVTGQIRLPSSAVKSNRPKSTPNSSPVRHVELETFYDKTSPSTMTSEMLFNKNAAFIDHDYGFNCRRKLSKSLSTENLGIQTPSASEPPTDSDDDCNPDILSEEYTVNLKQENFVNDVKVRGRYSQKANVMLKERKRNKKRKLSCSSDKSDDWLSTAQNTHQTVIRELLDTSDKRILNSVSSTTAGCVKLRLAAENVKTGPKRARSSGGSRVFTPTERYLHNTNEQVRRIEMRQSFEELRGLIPNLTSKQKAPKVIILQEAKIYCDELYYKDLKLQTQVASLKQQQDRLRSVLSQLRRVAAASRH